MNTELIPIIFIHHGKSNYLGMSLNCAFNTNPDNEIVLLGDDNNKILAKDCRFDYFNKFDEAFYIKEFNRVYKSITSLKNKNFIFFDFLRWIRLYYFMRNSGINQCYYFDSDTLICTNLQNHIKRFENFDFAVINYFSGCACFVNGLNSLKRYIELMLTLFQDSLFIKKHENKIEELLKIGIKHSFCDMQVFSEYQKRISPLFELSIVYNKSSFDPNISLDRLDQLTDKSTWLMEDGHKKIYWKNNLPYCFNKIENDLIKMNTLNMSWVKIALIKYVYSKLQKGWRK